jgi:carbonic anhydrase/acetyltransferase-like protein (isoleucine patch superfamily)
MKPFSALVSQKVWRIRQFRRRQGGRQSWESTEGSLTKTAGTIYSYLFSLCLLLQRSERMIRSFKGMKPKIPATCYVDESAQIIGDVVLGEHASVWMNAVVRGDVYAIRIGAHSNIQDCSVLHGMKNTYGVTLGEYVTVGHSVTLHGCEIEDRCLIGMGSIILNGAKIGAGSIIAAGTLIPERTVVEPGSLWMGSPGKFRRKLEAGDDELIMKYARNYLGYTEEYLRER